MKAQISLGSGDPAAFDAQAITFGTTNDVALVRVGADFVTANNKGELRFGEQVLTLNAPLLHDGLIAAQGRLYAASGSGRLYCFGE